MKDFRLEVWLLQCELCNIFNLALWRASGGPEAKGHFQSVPLCPIYGPNNPNMSMLRVLQDGMHYMSDTFRNSCKTASR